MNNFDKVCDLTPMRQDWRIRVCVVRKLVSDANQLHIIFADNRGVKIEAIIDGPNHGVFDAQLRQGDWATIENFRVLPAVQYLDLVHPTTHEYMIVIDSSTNTQMRNIYPSQDPDMFYDFSNVSRIHNGGYQLDHTVDLVGVVRRVDPIEELHNAFDEQRTGDRLTYLRFFLTDAYHVTVECIAHGVFAPYMERMWGVTGEESPLCVFRFGRIVRRIDGPGYRVVTTIYSQILLDIDTPAIPEVTQLRVVFPSQMNT